MSLAAVLATAFLGSLHCAAMCGGFVATVASVGQRKALWAYHFARLASYLGLGAMAGAFGDQLGVLGTSFGAPRLVGVMMGLSLIIAAFFAWQRPQAAKLVQLGTQAKPSLLQRVRRWLVLRMRSGGAWSGLAAGALTGLLPCGWLWSYLLVAAAARSAAGGALVMFAFWAGTVPVLLVLGDLTRRLSTRIGRHVPRLSAIALLGLGLLSLCGRFSLMPPAGAEDEMPPRCPHHSHP